jgi:uncharacterized membrane protein YhhN
VKGQRSVYVALAAVDTALAARGPERARVLTKPLLMPALIPGRDPQTQRALALGCAGDVALLSSGSAAFTAGLGSFLLGHAAWIAALRQRPGAGLLRRRPLLAVPYAAAWLGLNLVLWPRTGRDRLPVLAYSVALTGTALAALDTGDLRTAAGGAAFLISDTLLALERFANLSLPRHEGWVMATYTTGQGLLAAGSAGRPAH